MNRSLRNVIARALLEGSAYPDIQDMRRALFDAQTAVESIQSVVLVHGPEALIEAL